MRKKLTTVVAAALWCVAAVPPAGAQAPAPTTTIVSRSGNGPSIDCDVSAGGEAVAFSSFASDLVRRDTNDELDVFLASGGDVERVSVTSREKQSATWTLGPSISDDGTRVAFGASGYRLAEADGRRRHHFVRDTSTGLTERVTVAAGGGRPDGGSTGTPEITGDGREVAFHSHATNLTADRERDDYADVFVRNLAKDATERAGRAVDGSRPDHATAEPVPSHDGRFVAFSSRASNLVKNDDNRMTDVFRYDRKTGRTIRVSIASDGTEAASHSFRPAISADGRYVAFETQAPLAGEDTNGRFDVYVHDVSSGATELVSTGLAGAANGESISPSISGDGRYVAFTSWASDLVTGDGNGTNPADQGYDAFVRDRQEQETTMVSVDDEGRQGDRDSGGVNISPDGSYVCWTSESTNLVPDDDNDRADVFLRGPLWAEEE